MVGRNLEGGIETGVWRKEAERVDFERWVMAGLLDMGVLLVAILSYGFEVVRRGSDPGKTLIQIGGIAALAAVGVYKLFTSPRLNAELLIDSLEETEKAMEKQGEGG